eukprot:763465-Hanusia_phi.AAC.2
MPDPLTRWAVTRRPGRGRQADSDSALASDQSSPPPGAVRSVTWCRPRPGRAKSRKVLPARAGTEQHRCKFREPGCRATPQASLNHPVQS